MLLHFAMGDIHNFILQYSPLEITQQAQIHLHEGMWDSLDSAKNSWLMCKWSDENIHNIAYS